MATVRDVVLIGALIFSLAVGLFIAFYIVSDVSTKMMGMSEINQSNAAMASLHGMSKVTYMFDWIVFAIFMALVIAMIIASWFVTSYPVFMFIYIIMLIISVAISPIMSNIWESMSTMSIFGLTLNYFPITNNIMLNLPYYMAVVGFIAIIVMFGKPFIGNQ